MLIRLVSLKLNQDPPYDMYVSSSSGKKNRSVGFTLMNAESSRSHSVFQIIVESSRQRDPAKFVGEFAHASHIESSRQRDLAKSGVFFYYCRKFPPKGSRQVRG